MLLGMVLVKPAICGQIENKILGPAVGGLCKNIEKL
jgi:hypothetical protein